VVVQKSCRLRVLVFLGHRLVTGGRGTIYRRYLQLLRVSRGQLAHDEWSVLSEELLARLYRQLLLRG